MQQSMEMWAAAGLAWDDVAPEPEGADYRAHSLLLGGRPAVFRRAKTTPTKLGQFVTLWQRSADGPIRPFDTHDGVALFVIQAGQGAGLGQFVFPEAALARHGVVSIDGKGGKRAMRVYTPDVETTSAQARRSQTWQCDYFLPMDAPAARVLELYSA
ncbi:hypothetical protein ART_1056 [Arthrobacter sp. PAMC 25486]|uniref:MepB family protein n=1 Tax=Arthrobacter sp. PAMC 25486 TaxID=1494608 RepID=UPI0005361238|nr:MepB family protein [Arthrobacter sp. PAMC 25486]AIY00655.1 hypothetical protein ART_1056 [Arthrobacter sp. PAMC 25486]